MSADRPNTLTVEIDGRPRRLLDASARPLEAVPVITPVPLGPDSLAGLAQVDGEVLPVLWAGTQRNAIVAVLVGSSLGRALLLCGRVVGTSSDATPLDVHALLETLRHEVRG
ncbi:MAG: hypothetical protein ABI321_06725 [Polyangia bacterium]